MRSNIVRLFAVLAMVFISAFSLAQQPVKVELVKSAGGRKLWRECKPYYIYGAGGSGNLELLKRMGGNSIRHFKNDETL